MKSTVRYATPEDSEALKAFFKSRPLDGPLGLRVHHSDSYFDAYSSFSDEHCTIILENSDREISGTASFLFREVEIEGKLEKIALATDLRVSTDRESILDWTHHYLPILNQIKSEHNCRLHFSLVPDTAGSSYNALIRPRSVRRNIPTYHLLRKLELAIIVGRLPFKNPLSTVSVSPTEEADLPELCDYLKQKTHGQILTQNWSIEKLKALISRWPGLASQDILLARNSKKRIVGTLATWRATPYIRYEVTKYDGFSSTLKSATKIGSFLNLSRPLPDVEDSFDFVFLSLIRADNPDIFSVLLDQAYKDSKKGQHIAYFNYGSNPVTLPPKNYLASTWPMGLYTVIDPGEALPNELFPNPNGPTPQLDMTFF